MSDTRVIEAEHYREEVASLMRDPIIRDMAADVASLSADEYESWNFINQASREYDRRGGTNARSIGGPARAIAATNLQRTDTGPVGS